MIAVAELLKKERLPGNYFAPSAYVQGDFELGLIENRQGNRLIALPNTLLDALYSSLEEEVGPAAGLVLFQCGKWWGKYFYRRFAEEVSAHYGQSLAEMEMVEFLQCVKQCWKTYGWGLLNLDFNYYEQGFILATVENSAFAQVHQAKAPEQPSCYAESGLLAAFFTQLTGQELHCVQTTCEAMGAPQNTFVLGLAERVKIAEACLEEKQDHDTIMIRLGLHHPAASDDVEVSENSFSVEPEPSPADSEGLSGVENTVDSLDVEMVSEPVAEIEAQAEAEIEVEMPESDVSEQAEETLSIESLDALESLSELPSLDSLETEAEIEAEMLELEVSEQAEETLSIESLDALESLSERSSLDGLEIEAQAEAAIEVEMPEPDVLEPAEETLSVESLDALESLSELPSLDGLDLDDLADFSLEDSDFSAEPV